MGKISEADPREKDVAFHKGRVVLVLRIKDDRSHLFPLTPSSNMKKYRSHQASAQVTHASMVVPVVAGAKLVLPSGSWYDPNIFNRRSRVGWGTNLIYGPMPNFRTNTPIRSYPGHYPITSPTKKPGRRAFQCLDNRASKPKETRTISAQPSFWFARSFLS